MSQLWDRSSTNGGNSRQLPLSPGVVVLQRWQQKHSADWLVRWEGTLDHQPKTYNNLWHMQTFLFTPPPYVKLWTRMAFMGGHHWGFSVVSFCQQRFLCWQKRTLLHVESLQKITLMFHSSSGKTFFGQMKQTLSYLEGTHNAMYGGRMAQHTSTKSSSQLWNMVEEASWFGAVLQPQGLDGLLSSKEKWIPKCTRHFARKLNTISLPAEAQTRMGDVRSQRPKTYK